MFTKCFFIMMLLTSALLAAERTIEVKQETDFLLFSPLTFTKHAYLNIDGSKVRARRAIISVEMLQSYSPYFNEMKLTYVPSLVAEHKNKVLGNVLSLYYLPAGLIWDMAPYPSKKAAAAYLAGPNRLDAAEAKMLLHSMSKYEHKFNLWKVTGRCFFVGTVIATAVTYSATGKVPNTAGAALAGTVLIMGVNLKLSSMNKVLTDGYQKLGDFLKQQDAAGGPKKDL